MTEKRYRRKADPEDSSLPKGDREVIFWKGAVAGVGPGRWDTEAHFRCPCDERTVFITSPPHTIEFDDDGILNIEPSIGFKGVPDPDNPGEWKVPPNWCHFFIKQGVPDICVDSQCPGRALR